MKVRLYGFSIKPGNETPLAGLYEILRLTSGTDDDTGHNLRRIYFDPRDGRDFARGLVLTIKDQKAFCKLVDEGGKFKINVDQLQGEDKIMDFNFFTLNKKNGLGLYQQYFHSCSLGVFSGYLKHWYRVASSKAAGIAIDKLKDEDNYSKAKEKEIRKKHRAGLEFAALVQSGKLAAILQEYSKVKSFEYEFAEIEAIRDVAKPLQPFVTRRHEKVVFTRDQNVSAVATAVQNAIAQIMPRTGRVHVENEHGDSVSLRLENIPENFGEFEYDEVASALHNLELDTFSQHPSYGALEEVCRNEYGHIFMADLA